MTKAQRRARNRAKGIKARRHGAHYAWTIADEAARAGIPYAVAYAAVEQESAFRNIFGHDPGGPFPGQKVTNSKVSALIEHVRRGGVSNGVGYTQLTYIDFVKAAHRLPGGAAKVRNQCRIGFKLLADLHRQYGSWEAAFGAYNGGANWRRIPAAVRYSRMMHERVNKWQRWLALN